MTTSAPRLSLSPSGASCWAVCTAQPQYVVDNAHRIPPQNDKYSAEGVLAHAAAEAALTGKKFAPGTSKEMKKHALAYAAFCESLKWEGCTVEVERQVEPYYMPGRRGFIDFCAISVSTLKIVDYKYGEGVAVTAIRNKQMAIYARSLMVAENMTGATDDFEVEMHIWQPRVREGAKHTVWKITWGELVQFTDDEIGGPAALILSSTNEIVRSRLKFGDKQPEFVPSDTTCKFCPAKTFCEARTQWLLADTFPELLDGGEPVLADPAGMTDEALAKALFKAKDFAKWLNELDEFATARALDGNPLPGTKLVLSKGGHRTWSVKDTVVAKKLRKYLAGTTLYTRKFLTPKQALDALSGVAADPAFVEEIESLTYKPEGQPTVAPLDDPRPEYRESVEDEIGDLTLAEISAILHVQPVSEDWI